MFSGLVWNLNLASGLKFGLKFGLKSYSAPLDIPISGPNRPYQGQVFR